MNRHFLMLSVFSMVLSISQGASVQAAAPLAGWGSNFYGQLDIPPGTYTAVAAGGSFSLAIRSDGTLVGQGYNDSGQANVPAGTFTAIAGGFFHSLGIRSDGTLSGWGNNSEGEINVPAGTFTAVAAGWYHSLAIRSDGTLAAWGNNGTGQLNVPAGTFVAISANYYQSLAIRSDGTLVAWGCGLENFGQCDVPPGKFIAVAAGTYHSLAIRSDGTLAGWGRNNQGQINVPAGTFIAIAAGGSHSLAIRSDGTLIGWGSNGSGQIEVPSGTFTAIRAGGGYSLALYSSAIPTVSEWGLIVMTLLVLSAGTVVLARRRPALTTLMCWSGHPVLATTLVVLGISSGVFAQPAPIPSETIVLNVDSGSVSASQGTEPIVVFSHEVQVEDAPWIRLHFGKVELSGSPSAGNESFLRITSKADGDVQELNSLALRRWRNSSAYFNGDTVLIELLASAGTGENKLVIDHVVAGIFSELESSLYLCGSDNRVSSSDPRAARIVPTNCTGFLFNERANCLLTSGHCRAGMIGEEVVTVIQFNVPLSTCNGTINNPSPQHQYPFDPVDPEFDHYHWDQNPAEDWYLFSVFNNTNGLSPLKVQGASYKLATTVPAADDSTLQITGYGVDYDPPPCPPPSSPECPEPCELEGSYNKYNKTQQTHTGPYDDKVGTEVRFVIDILPGVSGAAVEHVESGLVYAICSGGDCPSNGYNSGTAIDLSGLQAAIACPTLSVCSDCNDNGIRDQCDLNCSSSCGGCNVSGCGESEDCNSNGVPDECDIEHGTDPDCNENEVPDECDIASEYSEDCDENDVPDECQWMPLRACCYDGSCGIMKKCECDDLGGVFFGMETSCTGVPCAMRPQGS